MEADLEELSGHRAFPAQTINLKLKGRVEQLYPAFDNSFFLKFLDELDRQHWQRGYSYIFLLHYSQESQVLWQKKVQCCSIKMIGDDQVIFQNKDKESIDILNLRTHKIESIPFKYNFRTHIYSFKNRKIFCLFETIDYFIQGESRFQSRFKLTFFSYDKVQSEPICVYELNFHPTVVNSEEFRIFQISDDCKLYCTYYSRELNKMATHLLELNQENVVSVDELELTKLIDPQALEIDHPDYHCEIFSVVLLKEVGPNRYLLAAQGNLVQFYILDTTAGYRQAIIEKIVIGDYCFSSPVSIFKFFMIEEQSLSLLILGSEDKDKSVKLIDWHSKEMIDHIQNYDPKDKFSPRLMKGRYLVQYSGKEDYLEIKLIDYHLTLDDGYLHMLLHLNQDFDDDLLQDCIALLQ